MDRALPRFARAARNLAPYLGIALTLIFYIPRIHGSDAFQWYSADLGNLYGASVLNDGGYVYAPPFAQLLEPFRAMPWEAFLLTVVIGSLVCAVYLLGPWITLLLMAGQLPAMYLELTLAEINFPVAVAIWVGLRYPAIWAVVLLTKLTPGIGLLWFAVRREWRNLAIALGATLAIVAVSALIAPSLWVEWFGFLAGNVEQADAIKVLPLPVRVAAAIGLVVWGARTDRPWVVPLAAVFAHASMAWPLAAGAVYWLRRAPEEVGDGLHERRTRRGLWPANQKAHAVAGGGERL